MTPERYQRLQDLFERVVDLDPDERARVLAAESCDEATRADVLRMVEIDGQVDSVPGIEGLFVGPFATDVAAREIDETGAIGRRARRCAECGRRFESAAVICPYDEEVLDEDVGALVGAVIDNYRIESVLGRGGMGTVYRATQEGLGNTVAFKLMSPELSNDPKWVRRFQREGHVLTRIRHENVVAVHRFSTTPEGDVFLVLDYAEGETLRTYLERQGRLEPADAAEIVSAIASGLDAAHEAGVVHRDLKPENVVVGRLANGRVSVRVLDFGIARLRVPAGATLGTYTTEHGLVIGTPPYMAPEQWNAFGADDVDRAADVFALAVIAYELLAGARPFDGPDRFAVRDRILKGEYPKLCPRVSGLPPSVEGVMATALSPKPEARPATAGAFAESLASAIADRTPRPVAPAIFVSAGSAAGHITVHAGEPVDAARTGSVDVLVLPRSMISGLPDSNSILPWVADTRLAEALGAPDRRILVSDDGARPDIAARIVERVVEIVADHGAPVRLGIALDAVAPAGARIDAAVLTLATAAYRWMEAGAPLSHVTIVDPDEAKARLAARVVATAQQRCAATPLARTSRRRLRDALIVHSPEGRAVARDLLGRLRDRNAKIRADTHEPDLESDEVWPRQLYEMIRSCGTTIAVVSRDFDAHRGCVLARLMARFDRRQDTDFIEITSSDSSDLDAVVEAIAGKSE